ncbi:hypothetical protein ACH41H_49040 [Streptomyces sp. NPDC020800]
MSEDPEGLMENGVFKEYPAEGDTVVRAAAIPVPGACTNPSA